MHLALRLSFYALRHAHYLLKVFTVGVTAGRNKTKGVEIIRNDTEVRIEHYRDRTVYLKYVMRDLKELMTPK